MLTEIIERKRIEIKQHRQILPMDELQQAVKNLPPPKDFIKSISGNGISCIAEIKKASPSKGIICDNFDPAAIARIYNRSGVQALSVLTDEKYFKGHNSFIGLVKQVVELPVLRKDFIIVPYQVWESRLIGADAILLIAACLEKGQLEELFHISHSLGMTPLVEMHNEYELRKIENLPVQLIGVNNRNLHTFEVSLDTSIHLKEKLPETCITVSESGIKERSDVKKLEEAGYDAVLVGETFMRCTDPAEKVKEIMGW